jgi:hypothetical protein
MDFFFSAGQELENSASSDAVIREKIARLPPELSETAHLDNLQSFEDGQKLLVKVSQSTGTHIFYFANIFAKNMGGGRGIVVYRML